MDAEGVRQLNRERKDRFKENELPHVHSTLYQLGGVTLPQACQVTRIARVTHALDPFHTLTRTRQAISRILGKGPYFRPLTIPATVWNETIGYCCYIYLVLLYKLCS